MGHLSDGGATAEVEGIEALNLERMYAMRTYRDMEDRRGFICSEWKEERLSLKGSQKKSS